MTGTTRGRGKGKPSFWSRDIGGKGRKGHTAAEDDDAVEHPPFAPRLPGVNLLPPQVRESIKVAKVRRWLVLAAVLLLIGAGALWWLQGSRITMAEQTLAAATAQGAALREQAESLEAVKEFNAQLAAQRALVDSTLAAQPQTTEVIGRLIAAGGLPVTFLSVGVDYSGLPQPGEPLNECPNPDPFGTDVTIGCLTFTAITNDRRQVSRLLEQLEADPMFVGPYVSSSALSAASDVAGSQVTFTGTAGISVEALATPLSVEQLQELLEPPATEDPNAPADGAAQEGQ